MGFQFYIQPFKYILLLLPLFVLLIFSEARAQNQGTNPVLTKKHQNKQDPKEKLAINLYKAKEYEKAAELFQQLYKEKHSSNYYNYLFNCLIATRNYKQAGKLVKQQKSHSANYRYLIDEAYVEKLSDNQKKSDKILNKILNDLPANRNQIMQITSSMQSRGFADIAIKVYQKASMTPGSNQTYNLEIANAYLYSGDYEKMFDSYIRQLQQNPADIERIKTKLQYVMRIDVSSNLSGMLKKQLLKSAQENPDDIQLSEMLLWYSLQTKDFKMAFRQAKAIDKRFGNRDQDMLELAKIAYSNYDYNISASAYEYIKDKKNNTPFYSESYTGYFLSIVKQTEEIPIATSEDYKELNIIGVDAINTLGINNTTSEIVINLGYIKAFKLGNITEAIELIETALKIPTIDKKNQSYLKLMLADILVANNEIWEATLFYSQVESDMKSEPVGHEAKLKNAKVFYYVGEFDWANTRLDVLKSATSKLISNDAMELSLFISNMREEDTLGFILRNFAVADLYTYQGKYDSAMMLLNRVEKDPAGIYSMEYAYYKKALLYNKLAEFQKADSVYNELIGHYPESIKADNALFERAEIQRKKLNNNEEAMKLYMILMSDYPESIYSGKARKEYRLLVDE